MSYPRTRQHPRSRSSIEADRSSDSHSTPQLAPPRPFFLAGTREHRSSNSSFDTNSLDPASDSDLDKDSPPEVPNKPIRTGPRKPSNRSSVRYQTVDSQAFDPNSLYQEPHTPPSASGTFPRSAAKPPPSSFAFPFQAHSGNPDPGLPIPGRRRSSLDSTHAAPMPIEDHPLAHAGSLTDLRKPNAPFMAGSGEASSSNGSLPRSSSSNSLYRQSAAGNMDPASPTSAAIPRNSSVHSFRAPFLAPSSRPNSTLWAPPAYGSGQLVSSPTASTTALPMSPFPVSKTKPPLPSTRLAAPLEKDDKPWLKKPEKGAWMSYFITIFCIFLGLAGAALIVFLGWNNVNLLDPHHLCPVMDEGFDGGSLSDDNWNYEVQLGGFGNGEFQMTTKDQDNVYLSNGNLYIMPTLTSDKVQNVLDGGNYTLGSDCTLASTNKTACSASSNANKGTVINPVMSGRINTKGKKSIAFGKVEIRAKLPRGDWLWPAIWMLPEDDVYGTWPASGEIDILEARGNGPSYPAQGANYVRSTLNYGPMPAVFNQIFGWWSNKRTPYSDGFHTYTLEWDPKFIRIYVDTRIHAMMEVSIGKGRKKTFWDKAGFPRVARNGSADVVVENPYQWRGDGTGIGSEAAPFDQKFYLIVNLAAGGTSGWFPDGKGGKPWYDGSLTAMRDFARAQDSWYRTWPSSADDRAFRVDYIKMWERC